MHRGSRDQQRRRVAERRHGALTQRLHASAIRQQVGGAEPVGRADDRGDRRVHEVGRGCRGDEFAHRVIALGDQGAFVQELGRSQEVRQIDPFDPHTRVLGVFHRGVEGLLPPCIESGQRGRHGDHRTVGSSEMR